MQLCNTSKLVNCVTCAKVCSHPHFTLLLLSLNMFFVPFSSILTCKYINHTYPVVVYTPNTPSIPHCLFLIAGNLPLIFGVVLWPWKHQPYFCSILETSKYVRRHLVCCLFATKSVISAVLGHFSLELN